VNIMSNPTYFEEEKAVSEEHAHVIISREGFGMQFSSAANDNKLPRALLIRRLVIGSFIMTGIGGVLVYFIL